MRIEDLVRRLGLVAHPEAGWYREVYRDAACSTIHDVMARGNVAPLHRVRDRVELWHFHGGAPLELHTVVGEHHDVVTLGPESPIGVVPPRADFAAWQMRPGADFSAWLPPSLHAVVRELTPA